MALVLAACGGGGGSGDVVDLGTANNRDTVASSPGDDATSPQGAIIQVAAYEYGYHLVTPTMAGTYTFDLFNDGTMEHDLKIEGESISGGTSIVFPGQSDSFTITLEPGTYTIYCSIPGHRQQGMEMTFTVS